MSAAKAFTHRFTRALITKPVHGVPQRPRTAAKPQVRRSRDRSRRSRGRAFTPTTPPGGGWWARSGSTAAPPNSDERTR
jgi:hypothetical protein